MSRSQRAVRITGGLRPVILFVLGLGWGWYGEGIATDPRYGTARGLASITRYVSLDTLGWVWVAAGSIAVVASLVRWCPRWQAAGFVALACPAALWGLSFMRAAASGSYSSAAGSAAAWLAFAVALVLVAGLAEPRWVVTALADRQRGA